MKFDLIKQILKKKWMRSKKPNFDNTELYSSY